MRKFTLLLVFAALSSWAASSDGCKITVKRTGPGKFDISAESKNVYVRHANSIDRNNYVYLADTLLDILCTDTTNIYLKGGHKEGIVTCWSQKPTDKAPKQDKGDSHKLSPVDRRNWLEFNDIDATTKIKMSISDDAGSSNLYICKSRSWNREEVKGNYMLESGTNPALNWTTDSDIYKFSPIILKEGEKLHKITLKKNKQLILVKKILLDYTTNLQLHEDSRNLDKDDIIVDGEITADLSKVELSKPSHTIVFECVVFTDKGPKDIKISVPVEVEQKSNWLASVLWIVIPIVIVFLVLFILWKFRIIGKIRKSLRKNKKETPSAEDKTTTHDNTQEEQNNVNKEDEKSRLEEDKKQAEEEDKKKAEENPDEKIFILLEKLYETDNKEEIIKKLQKNKDLKKEGVNTVIRKWNESHVDNKVDVSQMNEDSLLDTIEKGYISPKAKALLKKNFEEYRVNYDRTLISETDISNLLVLLYNSRRETKSNASDANIEALRKQNSQLLYDKTKLEKEKKIIEEDKNRLHTELVKLQKNYKTIEDDNTKQIGIVEEQGKKIADLEQKVNAQSLEHVAELDRRIEQLVKNLSNAQNVICDKDREIADEKKNVENIMKKKAELEDKYNKVKNQLDEVEDKHQAAMDKLIADNQEAKLKQKDKYEKQMSDFKAEMTQKQEAHEAALEKQKSDYEGKLSQQHADAEMAMQQLKVKHAKEITLLNANHQGDVDKLNATIKELGISVNVGRDEMIKNSENLLVAISTDLAQIDKSVNTVVNQLPIFVNSISNILTEVQRTSEEFNELRATDWSKPDKLQAQVIQDMRDIFIDSLARTGWMNNVARLLSYSRLPKLHDGFDLPAELEAHGISTAILERIYSNMMNLLGIVDMGILVPAVLANDFDKDNYEYKNGDTWIDRFFPEVSIRNYKGKVFDIVQVGYTIDGVTEKKPVVQYN